MSDSRFVRIYYWLRIHRALCTDEYVWSKYARKRARGMKRERYFRRRGNFHRFPHVDDFPTGSSTSYTHDTLRTYYRHGQDDAKFPLWKSTFVRQMQPGVCSFVHVCQRGAHRALPIARPDSSRDVVNMLIYWRRVRFEYTQVAKRHVWFLRNSFRWMTGMFVDISVNCCRRAEYWFLSERWKNNLP